MGRLILVIFCMVAIPLNIYALCDKEPILCYKKDQQDIRIYHCAFEGFDYVELKNRNGGYSIICELNRSKRIFLLANHSKKGGYGYEGYAISDTSNNFYKSPNRLEYKIKGDEKRVYISIVEKKLLKAAIELLQTPNSKEYNLNIESILFFVPVVHNQENIGR